MYPSRTQRNAMVFDLEADKDSILAGRLMAWDGEKGLLTDESGKVEFTLVTVEILKVGMIIELAGWMDREVFYAQTVVVLNPASGFGQIQGDMPNWQKVIADPFVRDSLLRRSQVVRAVREWFWGNGFVETETPCLAHVPGMEPYLTPFKTELILENGAHYPSYLITSPEYVMKKILVGGIEKIFQITHSYRNGETLSSQHNPEFTILEWYRSYASYLDIMRDTEELCAAVAKKVLGTTQITLRDKLIDLAPPWERLTFAEALEKYAGVKYAEIETLAGLKQVLKSKGYPDSDADWDTQVLQLFLTEVEPNLGNPKPTFIHDYPLSMAALSKKSETDPRFAERVEAYIGGIELVNGFTELNDADEQKRRLESERAQRQQLGKDDYAVDDTFIEALQWGMPPASGIALGVDRLVMLILGQTEIKNVLWCPWGEMFEK